MIPRRPKCKSSFRREILPVNRVLINMNKIYTQMYSFVIDQETTKASVGLRSIKGNNSFSRK